MRVSKKMVASLALAALLGGAAPQVTWAAQGAAVQEKQDAAAKAQEAEDAEAADGMEAGKAAAEESREQ